MQQHPVREGGRGLVCQVAANVPHGYLSWTQSSRYLGPGSARTLSSRNMSLLHTLGWCLLASVSTMGHSRLSAARNGLGRHCPAFLALPVPKNAVTLVTPCLLRQEASWPGLRKKARPLLGRACLVKCCCIAFMLVGFYGSTYEKLCCPRKGPVPSDHLCASTRVGDPKDDRHPGERCSLQVPEIYSSNIQHPTDLTRAI